MQDLFAVRGNLYSYDRYDENLKMHKAAEVDIDEEGFLTATYIPAYFTEEDMKENEVSFTKQQWYGIIAHFLRNEFEMAEEKIEEATEDIVGRCFSYGIPKFENLQEYIAEYLDRQTKRD